jgi:hypothetical protein
MVLWGLTMRTVIRLLICGMILLAATSCAKSPPPKPLLISKPLPTLAQALPAQMNSERQAQGLPGTWTGKHEALVPDVEKVLGADDYLVLTMEPPEGKNRVVAFVAYYSSAMSPVPHVPWVCMPEAGFKVSNVRQDDVAIRAIPGKDIPLNVILMEKGQGLQRLRAMVFHYFNVGGAYTASRDVARARAGSSGGPAGSFISQTQVIVWLPPGSTEDPLTKNSPAYRLGTEVLNELVPLLEKEYYPDVGKAKD